MQISPEEIGIFTCGDWHLNVWKIQLGNEWVLSSPCVEEGFGAETSRRHRGEHQAEVRIVVTFSVSRFFVRRGWGVFVAFSCFARAVLHKTEHHATPKHHPFRW